MTWQPEPIEAFVVERAVHQDDVVFVLAEPSRRVHLVLRGMDQVQDVAEGLRAILATTDLVGAPTE